MPTKTKTRTVFVCQQCGSTQLKWMGRCPDCGEWNTLVETIQSKPGRETSASRLELPRSAPTPLTQVKAERQDRIPMAMEEFNRVLGGGIVPGCLVLVSGDPGIGKSTLLTQVAAQMAMTHGPVLYVSGEESAQQIKMRADRLGLSSDQLHLLTETDLDEILLHIERIKPTLAIVDSIQTVYLGELTSAAGSISQVRECAARLQGLAKQTGTSVFLVGHVTKSGAIAGPKVLEHIVDTVLYLEGDRHHTYRLLRSTKNRFGATSEVGVFEMRGAGMTEVPNPSEAFLAERLPSAPGSSIAVTMEGTRPLLVEVQALCSTSAFGLPRRTANGVDVNRLLLLVAVLSKRLGLKLGDQDVFVNVIGGLHVGEPAADLAIAASIASSMRDAPVAADMTFVGEVGLSGELRTVGQLPARLNEAAKLGFKRALIPKTYRQSDQLPDKIEILTARSVGEALELAMRRRP
jgi:DNA repair protein RadA/Sms